MTWVPAHAALARVCLELSVGEALDLQLPVAVAAVGVGQHVAAGLATVLELGADGDAGLGGHLGEAGHVGLVRARGSDAVVDAAEGPVDGRRPPAAQLALHPEFVVDNVRRREVLEGGPWLARVLRLLELLQARRGRVQQVLVGGRGRVGAAAVALGPARRERGRVVHLAVRVALDLEGRRLVAGQLGAVRARVRHLGGNSIDFFSA